GWPLLPAPTRWRARSQSARRSSSSVHHASFPTRQVLRVCSRANRRFRDFELDARRLHAAIVTVLSGYCRSGLSEQHDSLVAHEVLERRGRRTAESFDGLTWNSALSGVTAAARSERHCCDRCSSAC